MSRRPEYRHIDALIDEERKRPDAVREKRERLIAAAPDMLEALEEVRHVLTFDGDYKGEIRNIVEAAIAKAKGETP